MMIKLLIVDDSSTHVIGASVAFKNEPDIEVVSAFTSGKQAVEFIKSNSVDVVVLDIKMPEMDGIECCKLIKEHKPKTKVVVHTGESNTWLLHQMYLAGATGFVMKSSSQEVVISTVKNVLKFKLIYEDNVPYFFTFNPSHEPEIKLTPTEKQVIRYYSTGLTLQGIADKMSVSYDAIVFHSKNIRSKFKVKRLSDVIDLCENKGITIY